MKNAAILFILIIIVAVGAAGGFLIAGPARVWSLFGDADLGPVNFAELQRRSTPNDALACPPAFCRAPVDVISPRYGIAAQDLRAAFAKVIASEERIEAVARDDASLEDRYIQRSRIMGFPDTINVRFIDLGSGQSGIAIYSRSQLGKADLGVNKARIERLLAKLTELMPPLG